MDLLSLPSEMLASVLKYNENLLEIRKISSLVDLTVNRFRIPTFRFSSLSVLKIDGGIQVYLTPSFQHPVKEIVTNHNRDEPLLNILQFYFSKMDQFRGSFRLDGFVISEEIATFLLTQRAIKISELVLLGGLTVETQLLRRVLTTFNIRRLTLVLFGRCPFNEICEGLHIDELELISLSGRGFASELTLNDLKQIYSRNVPRKLYLFLKDVKETINDSFDKIRSHWNLTIQVENLDRVKDLIMKLKCFENHEMSGWVWNNSITVRDKSSKNSFPSLKIRFVV